MPPLPNSITHNEKQSRFETVIDGEVGYLSYRKSLHQIIITYVFVPPAYRGKGYSAELIRHGLEQLTIHQLPLDITCSYVAHYVHLHPEWQEWIAAHYPAEGKNPV